MKQKAPAFWGLLTGSLRDFWHERRSLMLVAVVVALPVGLISLLSQDPGILAYGSLAAVVMNLALIWTVVRLGKGQAVKLKEAYYEGTSALVRFLLVALVLVASLLPFVIGATVFSSAVSDVTVQVSLAEKLLVGLLWLILSIPTVRWLTRYSFSLLLASQPGTTPIQALRLSKQRAQGHGWAIFGRLLGLTLFLVAVIFIPTIAIYILIPPVFSSFVLAVLQLVVTLTILPIFYVFLYRLYEGLA
ncbi:MAG TPA: hypothetical protein VLF41_01895 [Candidatus Nanoarchaeia archaeon]|nr:hypothetical protein [Candidatus Nanoarchaeia archaeon]